LRLWSLVWVFLFDLFKMVLLLLYIPVLNVNKCFLYKLIIKKHRSIFRRDNLLLFLRSIQKLLLLAVIWVEKTRKREFWWIMENIMTICNSWEWKIIIIILILRRLLYLRVLFLFISLKFYCFPPWGFLLFYHFCKGNLLFLPLRPVFLLFSPFFLCEWTVIFIVLDPFNVVYLLENYLSFFDELDQILLFWGAFLCVF